MKYRARGPYTTLRWGLLNGLIFISSMCLLLLTTGCATEAPSAAVVAALKAEFAAPQVVVDADCIFSEPVKEEFIAYRHFGLCLFSDSQLRLYHGGNKPALAFAWPIDTIKAYAYHTNIFTVVTDAGNFGLVVKDAPELIAVLRARGVREDAKLPVFSSKDPAPWNWM